MESLPECFKFSGLRWAETILTNNFTILTNIPQHGMVYLNFIFISKVSDNWVLSED